MTEMKQEVNRTEPVQYNTVPAGSKENIRKITLFAGAIWAALGICLLLYMQDSFSKENLCFGHTIQLYNACDINNLVMGKSIQGLLFVGTFIYPIYKIPSGVFHFKIGELYRYTYEIKRKTIKPATQALAIFEVISALLFIITYFYIL